MSANYVNTFIFRVKSTFRNYTKLSIHSNRGKYDCMSGVLLPGSFRLCPKYNRVLGDRAV